MSVVANDQFFVYFDDLISGSMNGNSVIDNLGHIFVCIDKLGFKLSIEKCQFGIKQIKHLGSWSHNYGKWKCPIGEKLLSFKTVIIL